MRETNFEKWGMAAAIPGLQMAIDELQQMVDKFRAMVNGDEAPVRKKAGRPKGAGDSSAGKVNEMVGRSAVRQGLAKSRDRDKRKRIGGFQRKLWASYTPEQKAERVRNATEGRMKAARKRKAA